MIEIRADDARQSAIFWALGHFYEYNVIQLAEIFKVPFGIIESNLKDMGYSKRSIEYLHNNDHPLGYCRTCHTVTGRDSEGKFVEFCSDTCRERDNELQQLLGRGLLPTTWSKNIFYDLVNHEVIRRYKVNDSKQ